MIICHMKISINLLTNTKLANELIDKLINYFS